MNSAKLKETIANIVKEESDYQEFFRKALEKSGKSITDMSDEEKKAFFNKIDAAWDGKGEKKNEGNAFGAAVTAAKEKGEDEFEVGGKTYKVESVNEGKKVFKVNPAIGKAKYSISSHDGVKKHKDGSDFFDIETFKNKVDLEKAIKNYTSKGFKMESVNENSLGHAEVRKVEKNLSLNQKEELSKLIKSGKIKTSDDLKNWISSKNESVNEISFGQGIKDLRTGKTSSVEGVKVSRTLANAIQSWVMSSPWGQRYGKQMMKAPFAAAWKMILSDSFGVEKYLSRWDKETLAQVKPEIAKIKSKLTSESLTEGRAFINAAKKAKAEGKTEFEFNGKTYPVTIKESKLMIESQINEDANMNKKVKALLDKELKDLRKGGSNHLFAVMHILMGALTDANFHSESKKVPAIFGSKAKYEGDPQGKNDLIDMYEYEIGTDIAHICKWDGKDIVNAVGFYVSMTIGRPMGQKIENLV